MESRSFRKLQIWLWVLVATFLIAKVASASDIRLKWTPGDGGPVAEGFVVFWGDTDPPVVEDDVGNVLEWQSPPLQDCQTYYFGVKAYIGEARSAMSGISSTYPRPEITNVVDSETGTVAILGNNFDQNLKVYINAGNGFIQLPPGDVNRISCTEIRITDVPLIQVQVSNVALPLGSGEPKDVFSQPWPAPTVTVE